MWFTGTHAIISITWSTMRKIRVICIGDLKFKGLKELEKKYMEKINFFTKLEIRNLKDISSKDDALKKKKERQLIMDALDKKDFVIALDQYGKKMDSAGFAKTLTGTMNNHPHPIVFLIGGHAGISKDLDARINMKLSFSDMVFAHDLFRVVFLEQLYRAFTIIKNIKYHR